MLARTTVGALAAALVVTGTVCFPCGSAAGILVDDDLILRRGDANNDTVVDGADIATITGWLYNGDQAPPCLNQADVNDDGVVDMSDAVYLSSYLYYGGPTPPVPGPAAIWCSRDGEPFPGCDEAPHCA